MARAGSSFAVKSCALPLGLLLCRRHLCFAVAGHALPLRLVVCPCRSCFSLAACALPSFVSLASWALPLRLLSCACASPASVWDLPPRLVKCRGRCFAIAACALPLFFALAASPSLLVLCPSTLPSRLVACAGALPSAWAMPPRLILCCGSSFAAVLCPPFLPSRLCHLCSCVTLMLCPRVKWLALMLCCQLAFFSLAALPSLLEQRPCASPSFQMAHARALPSACVLCHCCFAVAVRASPLCISDAANGLRLRFTISLHPSPLQLCPRGFAVAAHALPSWQMALAHALPSACVLHPRGFAITAWELPCFFAVVANGLCLCFPISSCPLPSRLCRRCLCVALVLHHRSEWLALALCH